MELINVCRHLTTPEQEEFGFIRIKRTLVFQAPILKFLYVAIALRCPGGGGEGTRPIFEYT